MTNDDGMMRMPGPRAGSPEAADAIWDWRREGAAIPEEASPARLRGALQALGGGVFGFVAHSLGWNTIALVALSLAGLLLLSLLLSPTGLYTARERLFAATGRAAGRITTWLVMVPLFYLFFLPFGRLLRRGRRDRLKRSFDRAAGSYWQPHPEVTAASRERQY